jgi:general secretion pathway protein D
LRSLFARFNRLSGRFAAGLALAVALGASAGCYQTTSPSEPGAELPGPLDRVRATDLEPRFPQDQVTADTGSAGERPRVYYGTSGEESRRPAGQSGGSGDDADNEVDGVDLNFENTPVSAVAKVILGDLLNIGYVIDPRVQGTISLSSGRKVKKSDLLFILESALRTANAVLVRDRSVYRILPSDDAVGSGSVDSGRKTEAGYGVTVIPLRHVSVQTISKLLDGFAAKPGTIRAEPTHNMIVVIGNGTERRAALDTVLSFDADFMRNQSVGIYPIRNTTPEPVIAELEKIMDSGENGAAHSLVKLQPVARLNAILVVARRPELLRTAGTWISRLDGSAAASTGVKVYKVRYGDARQIAKLLSDMFIGGQAGLAGAELAPGAGSTALSNVGRLGTGSSGQSSQSQGLGQSSFQGQGGAGQGSGQSQGFGQDQSSPYGGLAGGTDAAAGLAGGAAGQSQLGGQEGATGGGATGPALLPGVRILPDVANNAVVIYANQENYKIIERALHQIDRPQAQVAIDLTIAEVTLNDKLDYGVQFFLGSSNLGLGVDQGSVINTAASDPLAQTLPGFNLVFGNRLSPRVVINALHQFTDVKILSNPSLVVVNNQVATLQVGDQVPVTTGSANVLTTQNTIVNSIDYRNTGIILRVQPRINFNGNVLLEVEQEISNVADTGSQNSLTPTISQRRVKSSILVTTGQTVLLAGLIGETQSKRRDGIPLLDQLPVVGDAFSNSNRKAIQRTELIIFIRPQIIRDGVDASFIAEELRSKMRGDKVGSDRPPGAVEPRPPQPYIR